MGDAPAGSDGKATQARLFAGALYVRERTDRKYLVCFYERLTRSRRWPERLMNLLVTLIVLLLLFGGGGLYWGFDAGWGIGPIQFIVAVVVAAYLLNGVRGRTGPQP